MPQGKMHQVHWVVPPHLTPWLHTLAAVTAKPGGTPAATRWAPATPQATRGATPGDCHG
jgi:hypothetical protein